MSIRVSSAQALAFQKDPQNVEVYTENRGGICYNLRELFTYQAATQEQLKAFLFSDAERFSMFMQNEYKQSKVYQQGKESHKKLSGLTIQEKNVSQRSGSA